MEKIPTTVVMIGLSILGAGVVGAYVLGSADDQLGHADVRIIDATLKKVGNAETFKGTFTNSGSVSITAASIIFDSDATLAGFQPYVVTVQSSALPIPAGSTYTWNEDLTTVTLTNGVDHSMYVNGTTNSGPVEDDRTITVES